MKPAHRFPPQFESFENRVLLSADVVTWHNNNARTGANTSETVLTPSNVNKSRFGKLFTLNVTGEVYAQPLVVSDVKMTSTNKENLVFVATEADRVYAFDANTGKKVWSRDFTDPKHGITAPTAEDIGSADIGPQNGITATPVIDTTTGTLYVVTKVKHPINEESSKSLNEQNESDEEDAAPDPNAGSENFEIRLRALDIKTGEDKFAGSTVVDAIVPGAGAGQVGDRAAPLVPFNAQRENERAALLLLNGRVYISFASHGDNDPYHGWLFGYDAQTLKQQTVLNLSPDGLRAPIWQGGAGPAADSAGNIFAAVGNGTFDAAIGGPDWGDSVIKISTSNSKTLKIVDSFTPHDQAFLLHTDADLGPDGVVLLPHNEAVVGDKRGRLYIVKQNGMGGFDLKKDHVVQEINAFGGSQIYSTVAYFNKKIYLAANGQPLVVFKMKSDGTFSGPVTKTTLKYGYPGATPSISANDESNGIVWTIERVATTPDEGGSPGKAILHAYDANTLKELYNASMNASRDLPSGGGIKFSVPTIANGEVFVGTTNGVAVYGLLPTSSKPAALASASASAPPSLFSTASIKPTDAGVLT